MRNHNLLRVKNFPEKLKKRFNFWDEIDYKILVIKLLEEWYISPDLDFTSYEDMSDSHKIEFDKLDNIDKKNLFNI